MAASTNTGSDSVQVECIIPILHVADLAASLQFYTGVLGFRIDWQNAPMASVSRSNRAIMLCEEGQGQGGAWVWIGVEDIEPLYHDFLAKGVRIRQQPTNFPWAYEMKIEDPDGHVLRFGCDTKSEPPIERS